MTIILFSAGLTDLTGNQITKLQNWLNWPCRLVIWKLWKTSCSKTQNRNRHLLDLQIGKWQHNTASYHTLQFEFVSSKDYCSQKKCIKQLKFLLFVIRGRGSMYILCTCSSTLVLAPKFWCWFDRGWVQTNSSHHNLHNPGNVTDFGVLSWTLFQTKENPPPIFFGKNWDFVQTGWTLP